MQSDPSEFIQKTQGIYFSSLDALYRFSVNLKKSHRECKLETAVVCTSEGNVNITKPTFIS